MMERRWEAGGAGHWLEAWRPAVELSMRKTENQGNRGSTRVGKTGFGWRSLDR
jgi:hypothetical protein